MNNTLCLIPARQGSQGIKNKNISLLNHKPLITYPYKIAKKLRFVTNIAVSSDSKKYLNIIKDKKVIKILRPKLISKSNSKVVSVVEHALKKIKKKYKYLLLLEPTSPLTDPKEIEKAFYILNKKDKKVDFVVSVISLPKYNSNFSIILKKNMVKNKNFTKNPNRQNQNKEFFLSGNFYLAKINQLISNKSWISNRTYCYEIKKSIHTDIDNKFDLIFTKAVLSNGLFKKIK